MKPAEHVMILASAGSGKTYALTNRFVALLARGAAPERIVALTFTRKAAGEFFDEILHKLARAASQADTAAKVAGEIGRPELRCADFQRLLRAMVDAMPRLRLGTLDSFFARIARVFPFELGLAGDFEVLEEHAARLERQRVLRRMFTHTGELDAAQKEFIEAFKRATFGADEKQLGPKLESFLDAHQERFLEARAPGLWGNAQRIWPQGNPWLDAKVDRDAAAGVLREWLVRAPIEERQRGRWREFLEAIEVWAPGMLPVRELEYVLKKTLAAWPALIAGNAVLEFDRKKQTLGAEACAALADLTRHVIGGELLRRLATTRGIHLVLHGYEAVYHDSVRRAGKLTFGDVQRLLQPDDGAGALTREAGAEGRLFIDYRLDAEIDHWLLDEFQDTSHGQWNVLRNLIDEVVQDPTGTRSFFCVGDVKQAIFTWREGDPRLFREILNHYTAAAPGAIAERHLVDSWRSGPPLIELVNSVFGDSAVLDELFPGEAAESWSREWRAHVSAVPQRQGQAAVLLAGDQAERWERLVAILQEIRPLERGLTCAVLVPKNSTAAALADYLRRAGGLPAVAESDLHVCTDNPVGAALLALMQAAAYPGDTLAWEHVLMTPLGAVLAAAGIQNREDATTVLLAQIHADGFERTVERWLRRIETWSGADEFGRARARQFAAAAARYDQTGSRDVAEFIQFMERHVVRDSESAAVVRVMTIHKSKGLGFDVVVLPDLQGKRIDERRGGLAVQKAGDRSVEWVLDLPPKLFYEADDVLSGHVRAAEAEACYEALSLLYVALTRAKRGLYAIVEPAGDSVSRNYPKLLTETLGAEEKDIRIGKLTTRGLWASGDPDWAEAIPTVAGVSRTTVEEILPLEVPVPAGRAGRPARRPSAEPATRLPAARLFSLERMASAEFGDAVHALLAEVEWGTDAAEARWREQGRIGPALEDALACLRAPALAAVWREQPHAAVWRERAFEIVLDEAWVTGVCDRVIVERDPSGRARRATVFDFKTDAVADDAAMAEAAQRYASQLNLYRRVTAKLAGLPLGAVGCELVFTRLRRRVPVPAE